MRRVGSEDGQEFSYPLGSTCIKRSTVYHQVRHFPYHCVADILEYCVKMKKETRRAQELNGFSIILTAKEEAEKLSNMLEPVVDKLWDELENIKRDFRTI
ncbi:hypothetical protein BG004_001954 [Podila humilis]|nr:hypothetical protein BG004_001954 [Podila humilis]